MVAHFQKLFDAPSLSGVYPRMNEVYTRLGEMTNAMRNLRDVLGLGRQNHHMLYLLHHQTVIGSQIHSN